MQGPGMQGWKLQGLGYEDRDERRAGMRDAEMRGPGCRDPRGRMQGAGCGMQGPGRGMLVPSSLPYDGGRSRRGSPAAPGHPDVLVKHPPGNLTPPPPQNLCELPPLGTVTLSPPPLGWDPAGNSSRPPKRPEVRLGGRRSRRGLRGGRGWDHQAMLPFPSPLLWSIPSPFLPATLARLDQAAPGTGAGNWGPFSQPGIFLDFFSFPAKGDWCKALN